MDFASGTDCEELGECAYCNFLNYGTRTDRPARALYFRTEFIFPSIFSKNRVYFWFLYLYAASLFSKNKLASDRVYYFLKINSLRTTFIHTEPSLFFRVYFNKANLIRKTDFWLNFELQHVYSGGRLDLPNLATELKYFNSMVNSGQGIVSRPVWL